MVYAVIDTNVFVSALLTKNTIDSAKKMADDSERSLLYVALSRAMNHVMLTGVGTAPAELGA